MSRSKCLLPASDPGPRVTMHCCLPRITMAELLQEQGTGGSMMSGPAGGGPSFEAEPGRAADSPCVCGVTQPAFVPASPVWEPAWALASPWAPWPKRQKQGCLEIAGGPHLMPQCVNHITAVALPLPNLCHPRGGAWLGDRKSNDQEVTDSELRH